MFRFTIDKTKPEFSLNYKRIINSRNPINFNVTVSSEGINPLLGFILFNNKVEELEPKQSDYDKIFATKNFNFDVPEGDVQDLNFGFRLMDYAGNANDKNNLPITIDNEMPRIDLTELKGNPIHIIKPPLFADSNNGYNVVIGSSKLKISGTITKGKKGYDTSELTIRDSEGTITVLAKCNSASTNYFCDGTYRANISVPGNYGQETLNNLSFTIVDNAENRFDTTLFVLKDLKPPEIRNMSIR
jgi:hypothetical protein